MGHPVFGTINKTLLAKGETARECKVSRAVSVRFDLLRIECQGIRQAEGDAGFRSQGDVLSARRT
jgi:hypothetical protein